MYQTLLQAQLINVIVESKKTILGSVLLAVLFLFLLEGIGFEMNHAYLWFASLISLTFYRLYLNRYFLPLIQNNQITVDKKIARKYVPTILGVGTLWGYIMYVGINNAPPVYDFIILAIAIGFIASAILSTAAYIQFYLMMNLPIMLFTIAALIQAEGREYQVGLAVALLAFTYILISAIRYSKYFAQQHSRQIELRETKNEIIRALGRAGEYRDEETGNHILRMSNTCYLIAKHIGMSDEEANQIRLASSMHDVGKIGIPDNILLKPGKLTPEEYEKMKEHTQIGAYILGSSDNELLTLSRVITHSHHQKWNGTGYPEGLSGTDIPIESRIAAIADVFDALISERPYKKAWSESDALAYIKAQSGEHFDPQLVKAFLEILPQVEDYNLANQG